MGVIYQKKGDTVQALVNHQKSLSIRLSIYGEHHPDVAQSYKNIGLVSSHQGDFANENYQKSLSIMLNTFGESHAEVRDLQAIIARDMSQKGS